MSFKLTRLITRTTLALTKLAKLLLMQVIFSLRPFLGMRTCRYTITCTQYAAYQLQNYPLRHALWQITTRVLSCHPFNSPPDPQLIPPLTRSEF